MIRINLLPYRAARKTENVRRQVSLFVLSLGLVAIVMFYLQISVNNKIASLNGKVKETIAELEKYKSKAKEVDIIKQKLDKLHTRMDVMSKLDKNRKGPINLLTAMTQLVIPDRMWLESLSAAGGTVKLEGVVLDNKTAADFMSLLEKSQLFSSVDLSSVKQKEYGRQKMKAFQITCVEAKSKKPEEGQKK
ncbi:MAG: PilN domain-containing protein [Deltaproteobacteria bacterium]|nr:PilN domain-containing protein [Deltaproteobacteria bacterium]